MHKLSTELHRLSQICRDRPLTVSQFVVEIGPRAYAFLTFVFSVPFVFPFTMPGSSLIFGSFIFFNGCRMIAGKSVWLPRFLGKRKIGGVKTAAGLLKIERLLKKFEKCIRPRGHFLHRHPQLRVLNALLITICGFILALPSLPGTQMLPALTSVLLSLGILEEDGLFVALGYVAFTLNLVLYAFLLTFGIEEIRSWLRH